MTRSEKISGESESNRAWRSTGKALLWTGVALGAAALANAVIFGKTPPLSSVLPGELRYFRADDDDARSVGTDGGDVFYKKAGDGPPLLLVHSVGAGCSSHEFRLVWDALAENHTVYALDLLGFGKSDKPALDYSDATFINLLDQFTRKVIGVGGETGKTCDVMATSLAGAFVVALAQRDPARFGRLLLIAPTGIEELASPVTLGSAAVRGVLRTPVLGTSLYNSITSRAGIRYYLSRHIYADPAAVTEEVVDQFHTAAHQPGGERVLPSFVSRFLNCAIAEAFAGLTAPTLLVWGRRAQETPLTQAEAFLAINPAAHLVVIENAGMLPHEEQPQAFLSAVQPFFNNQ